MFALLAVAPFVWLQVYYLSDIEGCDNWLSYRLIPIAMAIWGSWAAYLFLELLVRLFSLRKHICPWFTIAGGGFLVLFVYSGYFVTPLVLLNHNWCRVDQAILWDVQNDASGLTRNFQYILMLNGRGNEKNYRMTGGDLNWTGDAAKAGMNRIDFKDNTFGYFYELEPLTFEHFSLRIESTPLSAETKEMLKKEIWSVLQQAKAGKTIAAEHGSIESVWASPRNYAELKIGGALWILLLVIIFQAIGQLTLECKEY